MIKKIYLYVIQIVKFLFKWLYRCVITCLLVLGGLRVVWMLGIQTVLLASAISCSLFFFAKKLRNSKLKSFWDITFTVGTTLSRIYLICVALVLLLDSFYLHTNFDTATSANAALSIVVNNVLKVPYESDYQPIISSSGDDAIKIPSEKEWMGLKCKSNLVPYYGAKTRRKYNNVNEMEFEDYQVNCVQFKSTFYRGERDFLSPEWWISNLFFSRQVEVRVNEYILQYPDILKSAIKILESPCSYIKTFDESINDVNKGLELYCNKDSQTYDNYKCSYHRTMLSELRDIRNDLKCDKPKADFFSRKLAFINIIDANWKSVMRIIVRRKDIK